MAHWKHTPAVTEMSYMWILGANSGRRRMKLATGFSNGARERRGAGPQLVHSNVRWCQASFHGRSAESTALPLPPQKTRLDISLPNVLTFQRSLKDAQWEVRASRPGRLNQ